MSSQYPSIRNSYDHLMSVRLDPMYVGMFLGLNISVAAICGSETFSVKLLNAALGYELRVLMLIWAMVAVAIVMVRNITTGDFSVPRWLLYIIRIPYDLFSLTLGALILIFVIFIARGAISGAWNGPLLIVLFAAIFMSLTVRSVLVLSVNLAGSNLRESLSRIRYDSSLRWKLLLTIVFGTIALGVEPLYRLFSQLLS